MMTKLFPGVCLNREGPGIVIVPTQRADLHWDRFKAQVEHIAAIENVVDKNGEFRPTTLPVLVAMFELESDRAAAMVSSTLTKFWTMHGREHQGRVVLTEADAKFTVELMATCWNLKPRALSQDEDGWAPHDVTDFTEVPDPSMSPAEFWHRLAQGEDVDQFSTIMAPVNLTTLIGGLARIPRRKEVHEKAAQEYRSLYDRAILMGNPKAIDYGSAVQVDNSRNTFYSRSDDASHRYKLAVRSLGIQLSPVVDAIVLHDETISAVARRRHGNAGGQARKRVEATLKEGLDILAVHFELAGSANGKRHVTGWLSERLPLDLPTKAA